MCMHVPAFIRERPPVVAYARSSVHKRTSYVGVYARSSVRKRTSYVIMYVRNSVHKIPPLDSILSNVNFIYILKPCFFKEVNVKLLFHWIN
jgi:hypothetical protein